MADGALYRASELAKYLFALDARTGEVLWTLSTEDFNSYNLMVADGVLYGQMDEGILYAVVAADGFILSWEVETSGSADVPHYTVADGVVYWGSVNSGVCAAGSPR